MASDVLSVPGPRDSTKEGPDSAWRKDSGNSVALEKMGQSLSKAQQAALLDDTV